jgi:nitrate/nitrite-specific signal transduction histidine kinase
MEEANAHIHDLVNKLAVLNAHIFVHERSPALKNPEVKALMDRIDQIVFKLYHSINKSAENQYEVVNPQSLQRFVGEQVEKLTKLFPMVSLSFNGNPTTEHANASIIIEENCLYQILENAVENSHNAGATAIGIQISIHKMNFQISLTDNGRGFKQTEKNEKRFLPVGMGTKIIRENMKSMEGEAIYNMNPGGGVILHLIFPRKE